MYVALWDKQFDNADDEDDPVHGNDPILISLFPCINLSKTKLMWFHYSLDVVGVV